VYIFFFPISFHKRPFVFNRDGHDGDGDGSCSGGGGVVVVVGGRGGDGFPPP